MLHWTVEFGRSCLQSLPWWKRSFPAQCCSEILSTSDMSRSTVAGMLKQYIFHVVYATCIYATNVVSLCRYRCLFIHHIPNLYKGLFIHRPSLYLSAYSLYIYFFSISTFSICHPFRESILALTFFLLNIGIAVPSVVGFFFPRSEYWETNGRAWSWAERLSWRGWRGCQ